MFTMFLTLGEQKCQHDAEEYIMEELGCTEHSVTEAACVLQLVQSELWHKENLVFLKPTRKLYQQPLPLSLD